MTAEIITQWKRLQKRAHMTTAIITQWRRLFLHPRQRVNEQLADGTMPDRGLSESPVFLDQHLAGEKTLVLRMIDGDGLVRFGALDFDAATPEAWAAVCRARGELAGLGLPALVAASGGKGYHLLVPFAEPLPAAQVRAFMRALKAETCSGLPAKAVEIRPDAEKDDGSAAGNIRLMPALHQKARRWGAFVDVEALDGQPEPGLAARPDLDAQARLLAAVVPATPAQFDNADATLISRGVWPEASRNDPPMHPDLGKLAEGEHPECIAALLRDGVPVGMQYDTGNLNLAAYCSSRGLDREAAQDLARRMAEATSPDHPTTKGLEERARNFRSNKNARAFACNYARHTRAWAEAFGGVFACTYCPARPDMTAEREKTSGATGKAQEGGSEDFGSGTASPGEEAPRASAGPLLPEAVALDLLAHVWASKTPLPDLSRVWPGPYVAMAAAVSGASPNRAGFFIELEKRISEIPEAARDTARRGAERFLDKLEARIKAFDGEPSALEEAGVAALAMARQLDARARIAELVATETSRPSDVPAALVAQRILEAANSVLQDAGTSGPLASRREQLFAELAKRDLPIVPTPFARLNDIMGGGLRGGRLYALLAPPKAGKTTLAAQLLDHAAREGFPALYLGFEMAEEQMITAALARATGINSKLIESRNLTRDQSQAVAKALDEYLAREGKLLEIREAGLATTISDAAAWASRVKAQHPGKVPIVVIDYLQLARLGVKEIDNHPSETKRVSAIAVACKDLARATGAVVVALSSVTKAAETAAKTEGELDVTAARDSLAIIHAADGILALQTAMVRVVKTKDEEEMVSPWEFARWRAEKQGDPDAALLERSLQKARSYFPNRQYHARLDILRNRGETGEVYLYFEKPLHRMMQADLFPVAAQENNGGQFNHGDVFADFVKADFINTEEPKPAPATPYRLVTDYAEASSALAEIARKGQRVGLDIETTGLDPHTSRARLLQIAAPGEPVLIVDLDKAGGLPALVGHLQGLPFVAHNATFEMGFLVKAGLLTDTKGPLPIDCTMLAAHVAGCESGGLSLKAVAKRFLDIDLDKEAQASDWSAPELTPEQLAYAARDAAILLELWPKIWAEVETRDGIRIYEIVKSAQVPIVKMALAGIYFDAAEQRVLLDKLQAERDQLSGGLKAAMAGREASGNDLQAWLEEALGGPGSTKHKAWPKTATGKLQTGEDALKRNLALLPIEAEKAVSGLLLPFKKVEKQLTAFGSSLSSHLNPATGRLHPRIHLTGTVTGRMSSSQPNIQQIPRDATFRALFKAPEGRRLVLADFGAMELRVAAQIAGEQKLIQAFRDGVDPHKLTASLILSKPVAEISKEERQLAKAVNFGLLYGQGAKGLAAYAASTYGVEMSEDAAGKHRKAWFAAYPAFEAWHAKLARDAKRALEVRTPAGRLRRWPHADKDKLGGFRVTEAYNTPVQGGAAEAMLAAMTRMAQLIDAIGYDVQMIATVHDELILEAPEDAAADVKVHLEQAMQDGFLEIFPNAPTTGLVEARIARTWAEK
jgi:DNA polymerase I